MKTVKLYLTIALMASILVACDLFFPYSLEDAPAPAQEEPNSKPEEDPVISVKYFSVGSNTKVQFSPGNLQYNASLDEWRFAPTQYNYVGENNKYISSNYEGWIDLFGCGTGDCPTKKSELSSDYSSYFKDWGNNQIGIYPKNTWRTLSSGEWTCILGRSSSLKALGTVNGVYGLILLPDNWERPTGVIFNSGLGEGYAQNVYTKEKWELMESAGAIFLPAAGYRLSSDVYQVQNKGYYWSAENGAEVPYLSFSTYEVERYLRGSKPWGYSVRLVKDL